MTETVKKPKAAAKPRKTAAKKKAGEPVSANPVTQINHGAPENHSNGSHQPFVSQDEVARLAHRFWKERGHRHGQHEDDWYRAEQVLRGKAS